MSREIKFRVVADNTIIGYEKLVNGSWQWMCPQLNPNDWERWTKGSFPTSDNIKHSRDQFTGKKDKNANDIYEGDILGNEMLRCVVEIEEDGRWILRFKDIRIYSISILDHKISKSAIVGNIHENPELLKEKITQP
jgi:hypothetical protein